MDIIRIPSSYYSQLEYLPDKDFNYVLKNVFELSIGRDVKLEKSLRGGLVISIYREVSQMENKARAKKGEKRLKIDIATLMGDIRCDQVKESNIKENNIKEEKKEIKEEATRFIEFWNKLFNKNHIATNDFIKIYNIKRKQYSKEDVTKGTKEYHLKNKNNLTDIEWMNKYYLTPFKFISQNKNGFITYL